MMDVNRKTGTLQKLLNRVQRKHPHLTEATTETPTMKNAPVAAVPESPPAQRVEPPAPPQRVEQPAPPQRVEQPAPPQRVEQPAPPRTAASLRPPIPVSRTPRPMASQTTAPPPVPTASVRPSQPEIRKFATEPMASGDVAYVDGEIEQDWSLKAVLTRAFRLTPR